MFALAFAAGLIVAFAVSGATPLPAQRALVLTVHDAGHRNWQAVGQYNSLSYNGSMVTLDYNSDQFLCSGFEQ